MNFDLRQVKKIWNSEEKYADFKKNTKNLVNFLESSVKCNFEINTLNNLKEGLNF